MIYELRIYHIYPGRMDSIHRRFADHTLKLFEKYGMKTIDFWEDAEGNNRIYYVLEHASKEARDKSFNSFREDQEWIDVRNKSEEDGPIVEKVESFLMTRVPYSPVK